jgi:hypothetical protein
MKTITNINNESGNYDPHIPDSLKINLFTPSRQLAEVN